MRKIILFLFSGFAALHSFAQVEEGASLGAQAGANFTFLSLPEASASVSPGASIGFFSKATVSGKFSIQPEVSAIMQNSKITFDEPLNDSKARLSLYYAQLNFLGVYNFSYNFSVQGGFFISYLFRATVKGESNDTTDFSAYIGRKFFNDINMGLVGGCTWELKSFDIGLRYNMGTFVIGKRNTAKYYSPYLQTKNSFVQLYCGYVF